MSQGSLLKLPFEEPLGTDVLRVNSNRPRAKPTKKSIGVLMSLGPKAPKIYKCKNVPIEACKA